jgi:hypothetical protein
MPALDEFLTLPLIGDIDVDQSVDDRLEQGTGSGKIAVGRWSLTIRVGALEHRSAMN